MKIQFFWDYTAASMGNWIPMFSRNVQFTSIFPSLKMRPNVYLEKLHLITRKPDSYPRRKETKTFCLLRLP